MRINKTIKFSEIINRIKTKGKTKINNENIHSLE